MGDRVVQELIVGTGVNEGDHAFADLDTLSPRRPGEVIWRDAVAGLQEGHTLVCGHIEQDRSSDERWSLLDAPVGQTVLRDRRPDRRSRVERVTDADVADGIDVSPHVRRQLDRGQSLVEAL